MATLRRMPLLTTEEAAALLRLKAHTLENMRSQGIGPPFRKHGGGVFFYRKELFQWSERTRRQSTSGRKP